jgi:hypothetical protein
MAFRTVPPEEICPRGYGRIRPQADHRLPSVSRPSIPGSSMARLDINGSFGKYSELYWSTGVLEYWKNPKPEYHLE